MTKNRANLDYEQTAHLRAIHIKQEIHHLHALYRCKEAEHSLLNFFM
jgi:hypothetical protein